MAIAILLFIELCCQWYPYGWLQSDCTSDSKDLQLRCFPGRNTGDHFCNNVHSIKLRSDQGLDKVRPSIMCDYRRMFLACWSVAEIIGTSF